jgi:hypothetical protein
MKKKPPFFLRREFMGIFIAIIMLASVLAVFTNTETEKTKEYNGHTFYTINQGWFTYINGQRMGFQYLPQDLENISSPPFVNLESPKVYLIRDPTTRNITIEQSWQRVAAILVARNIQVVDACSQDKECSNSLPIKDCETLSVPGVFFKSGPNAKITKNYMCYVIEGDTSLNLYRATEKLIYQILGVVK